MRRHMPAPRWTERASHMKGGVGSPRGQDLIGLGVFLAAAFLIPFVAGLVLDAVVHTSPLFLFAGLFLGIGAATFALYTRLKRYL
ncbi:MAG: AtpZ/AtpI family protein [Chloroflexi bacterium]|nr:MAG: AtpZ/AtpI family protein [Chloroflexota bacterium]